MGTILDLTGQKFGQLKVLRKSKYKTPGSRDTRWKCVCRCGVKTRVSTANLRNGHTKSCGCTKTHGLSRTPTYKSWNMMLQRCTNPKNDRWGDYGGRGVRVCTRWLKFESFYKDMGERPEGKTIDRIQVNGDYRKSNCRWASTQTQQNNMRNNVHLTFKGRTLTLAQWGRKLNKKSNSILTRLRRGWTVERALST